MSEYRIVAKIDPQTGTGKATVKQDLKEIAAEAGNTKQALNSAFDQTQFDRTIGALITRLGGVDASLNKLDGTLAKTSSGMSSFNKSSDDVVKGQTSVEAATRRVLAVVDEQASEQMKLNALLKDAKVALDAGAISQDQYARVQALAVQGSKQLNQVNGLTRAGFTQLGFQINDVVTSLSSGAAITQVFAQQAGQFVQAIQLISAGKEQQATATKSSAVANTADAVAMAASTAATEANAAATVADTVAVEADAVATTEATAAKAGLLGIIGGPWGIAFTLAAVVVASVTAKLMAHSESIDALTKKMQEDEREGEKNRLAKEKFKTTVEGVTKAINDQTDAMKKAVEGRRTAAEQENIDAINNVKRQIRIRETTVLLLKQADAEYKAAQGQTFGAAGGAGAGMATAAYASQAQDVADAMKKADEELAQARKNYEQSKTDIGIEQAKADADAMASAEGRINRTYKDGIKVLEDKYRVDMAVTKNRADQVKLTNDLAAAESKLQVQRDKDLKKAAEAKKEKSDGVDRFKSREQAIGIAGRELQREDLRVGENEQFGGVHGVHKEKDHGKYAIDVNVGAGNVEANVPDMKKRFDDLAKRYQARGYKVFWNGQIYMPFGNGPTSPIRSGDMHRDHMHIEAPTQIVGRPTNESTESQDYRDEQAAAKTAEEKRDFVSNVVDTASARGQPDRANTLKAQMAKAQSDYKRRFNEDMGAFDTIAVNIALTDADARENAKHFNEAYVDPLKKLEVQLKATGLQRDIDAKVQEEQARLGRDLTDVEKQQIANSITRGDQLKREIGILDDVHKPLEEYKAQLAALNDLLAKGAINQTNYNARVGDLSKSARGLLDSSTGTQKQATNVDGFKFKSFADIGAANDEQDRYNKELDELQSNREQLLKMGVDYDALEEAAHQKHIDNLQKIDSARKDQQLGAAQDIADSLLSITADTIGKNNALYKALFITEKAIAIARAIVAIQTGIAEAAANPFPYNLAAIASVVAATASIVSNISAVTLNLAGGGLIKGPGGPRDDLVPVNASNGEYMVNASAVARPGNLEMLERMNRGEDVSRRRFADGGMIDGHRSITEAVRASSLAMRPVRAGGGAGGGGNNRSRVTVQQHPGVAVETRENLSTGDVEIIARRIVAKETPKTVAAQLRDPNSRPSKALQTSTTAQRKRN